MIVPKDGELPIAKEYDYNIIGSYILEAIEALIEFRGIRYKYKILSDNCEEKRKKC